MNIDAIFFDLGMVLVTFDWNIALPRFAARNGGDVARVNQFITHPLHESFERGELSEGEFYQRGRDIMGFRGAQEEFQQYWNEIFSPISSGVQMLRTLAAAFPLYALSNTNPWHAAYLEQTFDWMGVFAQRLYSCELAVRKPDTQIYYRALERASVSPQRALLIDDRLENIHGAREIGMNTLHAPAPDDLQAQLEQLFPRIRRVQIKV